MSARMLTSALLLAVLACGGSDATGPEDDQSEPERFKAGVWEGTITSGWPGTLSFRVVNQSSFNGLTIRVPVFGAEQSGCETSWAQSIAIGADGSYSADLSDSSTNSSLTITGSFSSQTEMTGSVAGICRGKLVLLGMQYKANWVRD